MFRPKREVSVALDDTYTVLYFIFSRLFAGLPLPTVEPVPEATVSTLEERTLEERERWWKTGLKAISEGKLAVLLLAGGQVFSK